MISFSHNQPVAVNQLETLVKVKNSCYQNNSWQYLKSQYEAKFKNGNNQSTSVKQYLKIHKIIFSKI